MEVTLPIGTIIFILVLLKFAKPNFFNFGTVINNYYEKATGQLPEDERGKLDSQDSKIVEKTDSNTVKSDDNQ